VAPGANNIIDPWRKKRRKTARLVNRTSATAGKGRRRHIKRERRSQQGTIKAAKMARKRKKDDRIAGAEKKGDCASTKAIETEKRASARKRIFEGEGGGSTSEETSPPQQAEKKGRKSPSPYFGSPIRRSPPHKTQGRAGCGKSGGRRQGN